MGSGGTLTALVRAAESGDQRAWDEIVERFSGLLWAVARSHRLESHLAADVVQSTWLHLVESLSTIAEPEALPGWLLTVSRREALRVLRSVGREAPFRDDIRVDQPDPDAVELDARLLADERDGVLWRAFHRLDERCRALLRILVVDEPPPYAVVSAELGMPIGSIGPTRGRCLGKLRELLGPLDGSDLGLSVGGS
ncbi:MAG TPA: sigma-70 family RNA polymerase sigma factor [Dermatophilaceae bacterium]|nr:sigma-70 family RNA polymerase sigma factor [Dermatophilaceae bacterium]